MLIGFAGISHLSLTYLLASAEKNYKIIAFDKKKEKIKNLKNFNEFFHEKKLLKFLKKNKKKIFFTSEKKFLKKCKLIFISSDVLTNNQNKSDYSEIKNYVKSLDKFLPQKIPFVIQSQVYPGFCDNILIGRREKYYQVETLIFGRAIQRALYPEQIIVGSKSKKINNTFYKNYLKKFSKKISIMSIKEAELCKIAINLFLATNLTTANLLSSFSEVSGVNYSNLIPSLKLDKRIGKYAYLFPGLGISGGNIERDLINIRDLLKKRKLNSNYFKEVLKISSKRKKWVIEQLKLIILKEKIKKISILGLSYKKDNSSIKNSPSILLLKQIKKEKGIVINIYDDLIKNFKNYKIFQKPDEAIKGSDILILMREFKNMSIIKNLDLNKLLNKKYVIDPFGILKDKFEKYDNKKNNFYYKRLGSHI